MQVSSSMILLYLQFNIFPLHLLFHSGVVSCSKSSRLINLNMSFLEIYFEYLDRVISMKLLLQNICDMPNPLELKFGLDSIDSAKMFPK